MSDASVLKRKLAPPLAKALADCAVETLLRKTMPRDADTLCGLDLVVDDVTFSETDKRTLVSELSKGELVYQLANAKGAGGLCVISPELLAGLIEVQLYGYVTSAEVPERKPTRTDGIVVAALLDAWLDTAQIVASREGMEPLPFLGFARQNGVLDQRNAGLLIEPGSYAKMTVQMTLGDDAKKGTLCLAWPKNVKASGGTDERLSKRMERHLAGLNARLRVILARKTLPMEKVRDLAVDDVIDVPLDALVSVKLEGVDGTPIVTGRLGQMNGMRAVRLNLDGPSRLPSASPSLLTAQGTPPNMDALTSAPEMTTDLPGLPQIDGPGDLPDLPDLPGLPEVGDLPNFPDLPNAEGLPDLPDLPDLDDLPDLPDLPDMPELPDLP